MIPIITLFEEFNFNLFIFRSNFDRNYLVK